MVDSGVANAENRLEVGSKPHLASDSCVAGLFKMLTYLMYAALFHRPAPCSRMQSDVLKPLLIF